MRDFHLETGSTGLDCTGALLLYTSKGHDQTVYVTTHKVCTVGPADAQSLQILPGTGVTPEGLISMFEHLTRSYSINTEILPEHVLSVSAEHLVWWVPAGKRRVFFRCAELGQRWGILPHPPLMFVVVKNSWYVFALDKNERPSGMTSMFHSPYFNVYDNHSICTGSADTPRKTSVTAIAEWENAFFDSEFTHPNGRIRKASHPRGEYAFWKEMLDNVYETFPMQFLVPAEKSLNDVMAEVRQKLGVRNGQA